MLCFRKKTLPACSETFLKSSFWKYNRKEDKLNNSTKSAISSSCTTADKFLLPFKVEKIENAVRDNDINKMIWTTPT